MRERRNNDAAMTHSRISGGQPGVETRCSGNTAQSNERPMSVEQRRMIFALYRECGIDLNRHRHDVQHGVAGKTSLTDFTSHDAARLIDHLEYLQKVAQKESSNPARRNTPAGDPSLTSSPQKMAGTTSVMVGSVPAPKTQGRHDYITKVHKLPSPEQLAVLDHLYAFAGYNTIETQRAFVGRIVRRPEKAKPQCSGAESAAHEPGRESAEAEKHPRPRSMWEAEELIFALVAQAAPKMLDEVRSLVGYTLTKFEWGFLFENRAEFGPRGQIPGTFNNARIELEEYLRNKNKRGHRTMPRFSLTKFFEIVGKYK